MNPHSNFNRPTRWIAALLVISIAATVGLTRLLAEPATPSAARGGFTMADRIGANVWLQTAAEYQACCQTIYTAAEFKLEADLQNLKPRPERPAVVMDLDETVLDNSAFETYLYKNQLEYSDKRWAAYEEHFPQDVTLIPGAKHFILRAERLGVGVVFISNRSEEYRGVTAGLLRRLLGSDPTQPVNCLYLRAAGGNADKSSRREAAAARFNVLMYFGDNLRDFSELFQAQKLPADASTQDRLAAMAARKSLVEQADCHWGVDWFVIPNPVYGEWEKLIGADPLAIMHPTSMNERL